VQDALPGLHDIVTPEAVSWMPQTIGWVVLLVALVIAAGWAVLRRHRRRAANRYRVDALEQLAEIESALRRPDQRTEAASALPVLVKRVVLSFADRGQVASLTGEPWLAFLDQTYGGSGFSQGAGRVLPELAYAPPSARTPDDERSATELVALVRDWIQLHEPRRVSRKAEHA